MTTRHLSPFVLSCFVVAAVARAQAPIRTDSQSRFVHRVELIDEKGDTIKPESKEPYSPRKTCGKCHDYKTISGGYHFQAGRAGQTDGRHGEPWFIADAATKVQLPVSYRPWAEAKKLTPGDLGLTTFQFAERYGAHLPGGGIVETDAEGKQLSELLTEKPDLATTEGGPYFGAKWNLSGSFEIDCLMCHLATPISGPNRADQIKAQNFKWAPTGGLDMGVVAGEVAKAGAGGGEAPRPVDPELAAAALQQGAAAAATASVEVKYSPAPFNVDSTVTLDVRRRAPSSNCLFCHYTRTLLAPGKAVWRHSRDVHTEQGLTCMACHVNDIKHQITRGDGGPEDIAHDPGNAERSCEGCHAVGGLGAPIPKHEGLPKIHLEKITCTACHSGPMPRKEPYPTQTSFAHGLGLPTEEPIEERAFPAIYSPAFMRDPRTGKIGVYRYAYPIWWGVCGAKGAIVPLPLERIKAAFPQAPELNSDEAILTALGTLAESLKGTPQADAAPVYINAGKVFERGPDGKLKSSPHKIAEGYFWPIGHDVRPVGESLGAKSCADSQSKDAPFFFGNVIRDPLATPTTKPAEPTAGNVAQPPPVAGTAPTTQPTASRMAGGLSVGRLSVGGLCEPDFGACATAVSAVSSGSVAGSSPLLTQEGSMVGVPPPLTPPYEGGEAVGSASVPFVGNAAMARVATILAAVNVAATTQPAATTHPATSQPSVNPDSLPGTGPIPMHDLTGYTNYLATIGKFVDATEDQCFVCHGYKKLAWMDTKTGLKISYVDQEQFKHTVHRDVPCLDCHTTIRHVPHGPGPHKVDCATVCHTVKDAKTGKPYSHAAVAAEFAKSIHAPRSDDTQKRLADKPDCTYCHMNDIHPRPEGRPPGLQVVELCSSCHADAAMMKPFNISPDLPRGFHEQFHYKAMARGDNRQATCIDCHTKHSILPKEDPLSTVSLGRRVTTCGGGQANGSHPSANINFANTAFHMPFKERSDPVVRYTDRGFTYLTVGTMAALIAHILLSLYNTYVTEPRRRRRQGQ
jgi:hypothetical protein